MATDLCCPYCRQQTAIKILQKNDSGLSKVQCSRCSRSYELEVEESEMTLHKSAATLEPDSAGRVTEAMSLDELLTTWDQRLARAVEGISEPYARKRAYDDELLRLMKELRLLQDDNVANQAIFTDVSEQVAALGKDDAAKTPLDLIRDARRNSRIDPRSLICG
jgi:transcription elongation factor Elf1